MTQNPETTITVDGTFDTEHQVYTIAVGAEELVLVTIQFGQLGAQVVDQVVNAALANWRAAYVPILEARLADAVSEHVAEEQEGDNAEPGDLEYKIALPDENDENGRLS